MNRMMTDTYLMWKPISLLIAINKIYPVYIILAFFGNAQSIGDP
jgi:hypothetical protein